ncbi:flagellar biosynthetic protein FliO [Cohnella hashimotonis]|uniref:Flagellar biosynthetic protein FliO n=1 Tax=Cohnella hashimotonis TaxID=2826895 RepID=A0ABT6TJT6_9BACL|nr:flagellar biosynthetic protein FliO [Cohnella hashimotonis]MDI4646209.1 flagellar biosynthetic protein FliO [Cohnella hashimotonis]
MTSSWEMLWVLLVLLLMVGGIILLLRFIGRRNRGWWANRSLRSLGGLTLGANKSMQIVEWNNRIYVLGVGENVQLLESITDPDVVAALIAQYDTVEASRPAVPPWLKQLLNKGGAASSGSEAAAKSGAESGSFEQTLEKRLRELSERKQQVDRLLSDSKPADRTEEP